MENFLEQLRKNWILITFLGTIIIWSATINFRLTSAEVEIKELKVLNKEYINTLQQIQVDIAIIRTKLEK